MVQDEHALRGLAAMKQSARRKRAIAAGANDDELAEVDDAKDPPAAMIALIIKHEARAEMGVQADKIEAARDEDEIEPITAQPQQAQPQAHPEPDEATTTPVPEARPVPPLPARCCCSHDCRVCKELPLREG